MATSVITVTPIEVSGVVVSPDAVSIVVETQTQLTATVSPLDADNQDVVWSSDNSVIATVDANGLVTAVAAGIANISATTEDGDYAATSTVTVTETTIQVTGVVVNPDAVSIENGTNTQLTAAVFPSNATNQTVIWSTANSGIATVDSSGLVTAVAEGSVNISATTENGDFVATSVVTITETPIQVTGVIVKSNSISITVGGISQLTTTISPPEANDYSISWSSSDPNIATIDENGLITAVSEGATTITVKTTSGEDIFTTTIHVEVLKITSKISYALYPNPAKDEVLVSFSEEQTMTGVQVLDTHGRLILNLERDEFITKDKAIQFSVYHLKDAIYFLRIINNSNVVTEFRLLIKK